MLTVEEIREITDQYQDNHLECGGMSRVFHYYLNEASITHTAYDGSIRNQKNAREFASHTWIELSVQEGDAIIDYRARMWLGSENRTPHGVFLKQAYPHMSYQGQQIDLETHPLEHILYMLYHFGYDETPPPAGMILLDPFTGRRVKNSHPLPYESHSPYGRQRPFLPVIATREK